MQNRLDQNASMEKFYKYFSIAAVTIIAILSAVQFKMGQEK